MCHFFSLDSNGDGKPLYFDARIRREIISGKSKYVNTDSHTSIADYFGFEGIKEDTLNKYEYNPLTKEFVINQLNNRDDSVEVKKFCQDLDFKTIVPELIIHPVINPFKDKNKTHVYKSDIELLKKWASVKTSVRASVKTSVRDSVWASVGASVWDSVVDSVWASVGASVWDSVWASVGASVRDLIGDSVWTSVGASVGASVRDSVWASVGASVRDLIGDSVRASVGASVRDLIGDSVWTSVGDSVWSYISSFFDIGENPFQSAIDLWNRGLVPSFDGIYWRLHGKDGKIIWKEGF